MPHTVPGAPGRVAAAAVAAQPVRKRPLLFSLCGWELKVRRQRLGVRSPKFHSQ